MALTALFAASLLSMSPTASAADLNLTDLDEQVLDFLDAREVAGNFFALGMPMDATMGGGMRIEGERPGFLAVDVRVMGSGDVTMRATTGIDAFGWWEGFDMTFGVALVGVADWKDQATYPGLGAALDFGMALHIGRVDWTYRLTRGINDTVVGRNLSEHETRVGFEVTDQIRVFGNLLLLNPDLHESRQQIAYGLGLTLSL
jgi:hypothetical protein